MWLGLGKRVSDWKRITEEKDSRNDLILQSAKEQNRNSSNFRHHNLTPPVLVAERCQPLGHRNCAGDHLGDAQESVFKHQTLDIARLLVLGNQIDRDSTANTLPENNNLVVLQVVAPNALGWVGLAWGGSMIRNPLTVSYPNGQKPTVSSRWAT